MKKILILAFVLVSVQSFGQNILYAERLNVNGTISQFFQKPFTDSVFDISNVFVQFTKEHFEGQYQPVYPNQFGNFHKDADGIWRNFTPRSNYSQTTDSSIHATKADVRKVRDSVQANVSLKANASAISNINNTSDLSKPISTATQTALDAKLATNGNGSSLTGLTANQVGLGNTTNESKATMFTNPALTGNATFSGTFGFVAGSGTGGAITQTGNRSTGVTLNKISGAITTVTTSLAAGTEASFTVTNSTVAIGDVVLVSARSGQTAATSIPFVTAVANGSFQITLSNFNATTADTGAMVINFIVIKAVSN